MDPALKATTTQPWSRNSFGKAGNSPGSEGGAHPAHEIQQRGGDGRVRLHGVVHHENGRLWKERAGRTVLNAPKYQHPPLPPTLLLPPSAEGTPFFWLLCTSALIQLLNNIWASSSWHKAGSLCGRQQGSASPHSRAPSLGTALQPGTQGGTRWGWPRTSGKRLAAATWQKPQLKRAPTEQLPY